jgi:hypothetical protein
MKEIFTAGPNAHFFVYGFNPTTHQMYLEVVKYDFTNQAPDPMKWIDRLALHITAVEHPVNRLNVARNEIARKSRRGAGNTFICSDETLTLLDEKLMKFLPALKHVKADLPRGIIVVAYSVVKPMIPAQTDEFDRIGMKDVHWVVDGPMAWDQILIPCMFSRTGTTTSVKSMY